MPAERQITANYSAKSAAHARYAAIAALAERQHGVVALAQLAERGVSERTARDWVASRRLRRMHHGVFALGHRALRREGHWMAAVLACGHGAVLSHQSAAALHDLRHSDAGRTDVSVRGRNGRSRQGMRVHSGDRLQADELTEVSGIPCVTVDRAILDLAAVLGRRSLEQLCERAVRIGVFDLYGLTRLRIRHRGRRGVARLERVIQEWDHDLARTRSEPEVLLLRQLIEAGVERPVVNGILELGGMRFEADFHWQRHRLIVETDSKAFHDNPLARRRDGERDRAAASAGWRTLRLNWLDINDHRARTLTAITRALGRSTAPSGR